MNHTTQGVLLGASLAVALIAAGVAIVVSGAVSLPEFGSKPPQRLLVLATAPSDEGLLAQFAVVMNDESSAEPLDVGRRVVVSGTSAETPRDAYPFVGGSGVSRALSPQTGEQLDWVVLPADEWTAMVDEAGGIRLQLPTTMSAYIDGELVVLEQGEHKLTGAETVAMVSALPYFEEPADRDGIEGQLSSGLASVLESKMGELPELVERGRAESSLEPSLLRVFVGR